MAPIATRSAAITPHSCTGTDESTGARASIGLRARLASHLTGTADASLRVRRTNFPGYEPGVFPSSREYDIDWRYDNWLVAVGLEYRL